MYPSIFQCLTSSGVSRWRECLVLCVCVCVCVCVFMRLAQRYANLFPNKMNSSLEFLREIVVVYYY